MKVVEFSETSCVVTLYTRDFGKITALAKGARRLRSPFEGAIDLLATCRLVFLRKSVDKLDLMTEAKLLRRFRSASEDLSRLYGGLYAIELVAALTDHADPQPELFDLLSNTVETIDTTRNADRLTWEILRFELELLRLLGHQPSLDHCVGCGKRMPPTKVGGPRLAFGLLAGGIYCQPCRGGKRSVIGLRPETLQFMNQRWDRATMPENSDRSAAVHGELRGLLDQYFAALLGYRPKMQKWLKAVFRS